MKMLFVALILLLASSSFAKTRNTICSYYYRHDIFSQNLYLILEKDNGKQTLYMDTPTPYGIRVYPYDMKKVQCGTASLEIEAIASNQRKVAFKYPVKDGTSGVLIYFNELNERVADLVMKCSAAEIKNFCGEN
jgi:hypothetical protein